MKHLTEKQIHQFVDGTTDYMTQATCTNHLATCQRCRREVELQRAIMRTARETGLLMPSRSFTRKVMSRIVPSRARTAGRWVLDNMGAMFAMMAVLGLTGTVVLNPAGDEGSPVTLPSFDLSAGSQRATELWTKFSDFVAGMIGMVHLPPISSEGQLVLIITSVGALLVLDRFLNAKMGSLARRDSR